MPVRESARSAVPLSSYLWEYERSILWNNTAGVPFVLEDALRSADYWHPVHLLRLVGVTGRWRVIQLWPYFMGQYRVNKERARLCDLGQRMGGMAVCIQARIGPLPPAQAGSVLRIQTQEHGHVDMMLTEDEDSMRECLEEASEYVPKFRAFLQQQEPVLVFEHDSFSSSPRFLAGLGPPGGIAHTICMH
jgi:hypothetical protein